jgi:hypothetical protein
MEKKTFYENRILFQNFVFHFRNIFELNYKKTGEN